MIWVITPFVQLIRPNANLCDQCAHIASVCLPFGSCQGILSIHSSIHSSIHPSIHPSNTMHSQNSKFKWEKNEFKKLTKAAFKIQTKTPDTHWWQYRLCISTTQILSSPSWTASTSHRTAWSCKRARSQHLFILHLGHIIFLLCVRGFFPKFRPCSEA